MKKRSLRLSAVRGKAKALLLSVLALSVFALSMLPSGASAYTHNEYSVRALSGHVWTIGNGLLVNNEDSMVAQAETSSSICVGPVTYDGSYHMPYGWGCKPFQVVWEFTPITAYSGYYNPNNGTVYNSTVVASGF